MELSQLANTTFITNQPQLVAEIIEGEAIIVHLETGTYYSLRNVAAFLWERLIEGSNTAGLLKAMEAHYTELPATAGADLQTFLAELIQDGLIVEHDQPELVTQTNAPAAPGHQATYSRPVVEKFTDMSDLLLLDPIHEVDEEGWPFKKNQANPKNNP